MLNNFCGGLLVQPWVHQKSIKQLFKIVEKSFKHLPRTNQNATKANQKYIKIGSWAPRGPKTSPKPFQNPKQGPMPNPSRALFREAFPAMLAPSATRRLFKMHTKF